jgi:PLP dependent protein
METGTETIRENFERVQERIYRAAHHARRKVEDIRLVVVTKAQPAEVIQAVIAAGAQILGENYPEETVPKMDALNRPDGVQWHMIGHLQSRKAGLVVENFDLLQSLDSLSLAERLNRLAAAQGRVLPVMLEINVSGEESKFGWAGWDETGWAALSAEVERVLALPNIAVRGLMTMPPFDEDPEQTRPYFVRLRRLADFFARRFDPLAFCELSMGTSVDFETGVQEGATFVRVGTAIVGPRPRPQAGV